MVRAWRTIPVILIALAAGNPASAQQIAAPNPTTIPRLVWINSQAVLAATPGRAAAESLFTREMVGYRAEVQRLQAAFDSSVAEYNRAAPVMTPAAKTAREDQLRQMQQRNQARAQELDTQAQTREAELTAPIMQRVNAVIEGVRAEFNYAFVFDVAAQGNPIVTADRALDLTAFVIQRLQAAGDVAPPAGAAPATPGRDSSATRPAPVPAGPRLRPRP
jgi:Skp family chaperone for outer membrane proteins